MRLMLMVKAPPIGSRPLSPFLCRFYAPETTIQAPVERSKRELARRSAKKGVTREEK